jgi:hypothetical protein
MSVAVYVRVTRFTKSKNKGDTTFGIMTFNIATHSITTFSIIINHNIQHNTLYRVPLC